MSLTHRISTFILLVGVAVAGEATSTSSAGDMARALDAVLNPQPQEEGETERRAPGQCTVARDETNLNHHILFYFKYPDK